MPRIVTLEDGTMYSVPAEPETEHDHLIHEIGNLQEALIRRKTQSTIWQNLAICRGQRLDAANAARAGQSEG